MIDNLKIRVNSRDSRVRFNIMRRLASSLCLTALMSMLANCDRSPSARNVGAPAPEKAIHFQVRGILHRFTPDRRRAVIAHDEIAGYMKAMTMEFDLGDPGEASDLQPGDILTFRLSVTDTKSWIDQIRKTGRTELPASRAATEAAGSPASIRTLPDTALIDQRGQRFNLNDLRGRAIAITFMFTRCPLPNFCPLMSRNFEIVQRQLAAAAPAERWRLLSITIDPEHDTPDILAKYAANYAANPQQWLFATGAEADIRQLGSVFGLEFASGGGQINHNLRTVVVDPAGGIQRVFDGNDWQPAELVTEMRRVITNAP